MRKLFSLVAALSALALASSTAQAQNLLANGSLDDTAISTQVLATPTNWDVTATTAIAGAFNDGASSEGFAGSPAATIDTGVNDKGLFVKAFAGNTTRGDLDVDFTQALAATPGTQYRLSGYAGAGAGYSGLIAGSRTQTLLALDFLDAGSSVLSSSVLDLRAAGLTSGANFGYTLFSVTGTAPAGTAGVQARVSVVDAFANSGDQAFVLDDFSLTVVPEPSTVALAGLGLAGLGAVRRRRK